MILKFVRRALPALSLFLLSSLVACHHPAPPNPSPGPIDFAAPLPAGTLALRKLSPGEYPDFSAAISAPNIASVSKAIDNSLRYLAAPSSRQFFPYLDITHERAVDTLNVLKQVIAGEAANAVLDGGRRFDAVVRNTFDVYESIGAPDPQTGSYTGQVLFTAYFTPIYDASLTRTSRFQHPIYRRPKDLMLDPAGDHAGRKSSDGSIVPYYTRQQIDQQHVLAGQELCWLADPFDAYMVNVQGSARLRLPDGRIYEIGYNGNNGYPYVSPGDQMVADGVIAKKDRSATTIRAYFAAHPDAMDHYLSLNARYIFFIERPGGPFGKLNVPVTPFGTIATDKSVYPRAMPAFLDVPMVTPAGTMPFHGLMLDQDTGGGIRAAGRCDIYMGVGPEAEQVAGQQLFTGKLFYLAVK